MGSRWAHRCVACVAVNDSRPSRNQSKSLSSDALQGEENGNADADKEESGGAKGKGKAETKHMGAILAKLLQGQ